MIVELSGFTYYFSLRGNSGGLYSMEYDFKLLPDRTEGVEDVKAAMRGLMQAHTDVLDRLYADVLTGERVPILTDTPHSLGTGYRYRGRLIKRGLGRIAKRLEAVFGEAPEDLRGDHSVFGDRRATVECSARKDGSGFDDVTVTAKYELDHMLNVCFFRFAGRLEGVEVKPGARRHMDGLDRRLATGWEREGVDHYRSLMAKP